MWILVLVKLVRLCRWIKFKGVFLGIIIKGLFFLICIFVVCFNRLEFMFIVNLVMVFMLQGSIIMLV